VSTALNEDELRRWTDWKRATDAVWDRVARAIAASTGLSVADFSVLTRVVESEAPIRQQELADALGWSRSRLSRQLGRMEGRDLLTRSVSPSTSRVEATEAGVRLARSARVAHADAVREALLRRVPDGDDDAFWKVITLIGS
jgi:DNA-binding MarR family transcriptional regulator